MAKNPLKLIENGVMGALNDITDRRKAMRSYLARNLYRQYQNAQRDRWRTENKSQGTPWAPLNSIYQKRKWAALAKSNYPGKGRKMLIYSGRLFQSVIGPGKDHRVVVTDRSIEIGTTTPYAPYVGAVRPFMEFSAETEQQWLDDLVQFVVTGLAKI